LGRAFLAAIKRTELQQIGLSPNLFIKQPLALQIPSSSQALPCKNKIHTAYKSEGKIASYKIPTFGLTDFPNESGLGFSFIIIGTLLSFILTRS